MAVTLPFSCFCPFLSVFLAAGLLWSLNVNPAATQYQLDTAWSRGFAWLVSQRKGEGNWKTGPGAEMITVVPERFSIENPSHVQPVEQLTLLLANEGIVKNRAVSSA